MLALRDSSMEERYEEGYINDAAFAIEHDMFYLSVCVVMVLSGKIHSVAQEVRIREVAMM